MADTDNSDSSDQLCGPDESISGEDTCSDSSLFDSADTCTHADALDAAGKDADANAGQTDVGSPVSLCPAPDVTLTLNVIRNAIVAGIGLTKSWVTVKASTDDVVVEATLNPNVEEYLDLITWSGDLGVPGDRPNQRKLSRAISKTLTIGAEFRGSKDYARIWIIWSELEIKIDGEIDQENDAAFLEGKHHFPSRLGNTTKLGPWNMEDYSRIFDPYAYTTGNIQAKATLTPPGAEKLVASTAWKIRRSRRFTSFSNAKRDDEGGQEHDDTSQPEYSALDPTSGSKMGTLYDLDGPGCPARINPFGVHVDHTAETYANFKGWVTVMLDGKEFLCSDVKLWSYEARVDVDKDHNKVELNKLYLIHIDPLPTVSHYKTR